MAGNRISERGNGILLSITSLPSGFGIGDLGPPACRFADFLEEAGQRYWQILPLNPTNPACDNSPYLCSSAFAGNTQLISPELMARDGLLSRGDLENAPDFPSRRIDYPSVQAYKEKLFRHAYASVESEIPEERDYQKFCSENAWWLDDFALFSVLGRKYGEADWVSWPNPVKTRDPVALASCRRRHARDIGYEKFSQYLFFRQWDEFHRYCTGKGVHIIGDIPIYLHFNSADVWMHPSLFQLDAESKPAAVAGVPPDYFSKTGQLWSNPLYRWEEHEATGFSWWIDRFRHTFSLFDLVRIDHFRGLVAYYTVPAGARDAREGHWVDAPSSSFFRTMKEKFPSFPVIAEDLGVITRDVRDVMTRYDLPGMRVLQFAFTDATPANPHAPHNLERRLVIYTGTHDNPPIRGWFEHHATTEDKRRLHDYLGRDYSPEELPDVFLRMAMMSVAGTCIIPLQDILGLGDEARMNTPGTTTGNWTWQATEEEISCAVAERLRDLTWTYGRTGSPESFQ